MHKFIAASTILEHELSELRLLVERQAGIVLDCPNSALTAQVGECLESQKLNSAAHLLDRLRDSDQDPSTLAQLLDGLINNSTGFFRHPGALQALTGQALPQLYARKSADGPTPLRIWSAGCSTGEETYSIAMAICAAISGNGGSGNSSVNGSSASAQKNGGRNGGVRENSLAASSLTGSSLLGSSLLGSSASGSSQASPTYPVGWPIHIVGSDLLPSNIQAAERGLYPQSALFGLPPASIRTYFSRIGSASSAAGAPGNGAHNNLPANLASSENRNESYRNSADATSAHARTADRNASDGASAESQEGSSVRLQNSAPPSCHLLVKPRLRSLVTFNVMNLARPGYIGRFDCIFCMDVLPHFSRAQRVALLERLHLYLEPGGYLFLSQTEKLIAPNLNFRSETFDGYTFHRKPVAASAAYGR
jgi:chemotaxis methyl-accepting protein methylase